MTIPSDSKFQLYKSHINNLPHVEKSTIMTDTFLLEKEESKQLSIYYAPFEYINNNARVVLVGISPGFAQMEKSFETVHQLSESNLQEEEVLQQVKNSSNFYGQTRTNLIQMLDEL